MKNKTKITLALLTTALIAPVTVLAGLTAPIAFGATAVLGMSSIALGDYSKTEVSYTKAPAAVKRTERHPLAA